VSHTDSQTQEVFYTPEVFDDTFKSAMSVKSSTFLNFRDTSWKGNFVMGYEYLIHRNLKEAAE